MAAMLDLVGSILIGGLLLMMIINVNTNMTQMSMEDRMELMVQESLAVLIDEIEYDFRKIGYGVANPSLAIISADSSSISFWADLENNGSIERVDYSLGSVSEVAGTVNPRDRILHRSINGQSYGGSLGVVDFQVTLHDVSGAVTTDTKVVKWLEYYLMLESAFPFDTVYARSVWNGSIRPKNL
ncbi:hypothetical protein CEE37_10665 [candidate division LCP-89 bacterium B3_LCP]|uniref:Type 4 fimbrial biogenesis protein PilX N-terminal domain-containing protein n=1 Tax=candidate division LCP-89 bacterium B3_LCP TaxID=2012998 RepID=A0A532UXV7_UNCL8|nr:MAG: hypothetical protein CEE37_10665 [candidate division LCP-89 bacterium B3_LCP]